jgi:hypothetical protein
MGLVDIFVCPQAKRGGRIAYLGRAARCLAFSPLGRTAMKRTISWNRYRILILVGAAVLFGASVFRAVKAWSQPAVPDSTWWQHLVVPAVAVFMAWHAWGLKKVQIDDQNLYVSERGRTVVIPISQIVSVSGGQFTSPSREVCITFKETTPVGDELMFCLLPKGFRLKGDHRDVQELKRLAGLTRSDQNG